MEEVWSTVHSAGCKPMHCRLKTSETEISTAPWRRSVCLQLYADQCTVASFQPKIGGSNIFILNYFSEFVIVMRDRQLCKTSISSERTLQTVTIAIGLMLVHCTKLVYPICQLSSNVIWLKTEMTHYASTEKKFTAYLYL